jgi:hypothetical protein
MRVHHAMEYEPAQIITWVQDVECMYDGGLEGSNLQVFENAAIPHDSAWPPNGPQYIEAIGSGTARQVVRLHAPRSGARRQHRHRGAHWDLLRMKSSADLLWADIDNDGSVSEVEITVGPKPKPPS